MESPTNDRLRPRKGIINWMMTYRLDADIWYPYGRIEALQQNKTIDYEEIWAMKSANLSPAAWVASNCEAANHRSKLIDAIEHSGLKIDKWGKCGKQLRTCERAMMSGPCVDELIRPYKFYMAFENSNCIDYVTEKFWYTLHSRFAVPIVIVRRIYQKLGVPDDAYIALDDFQNLEHFTSTIKKIAKDKNAYLKYHTWREDYKTLVGLDDSTGFCELCRRLQLPQPESRSYDNLTEWNSDKLMCNNLIADKYFKTVVP